MNFISLIGAFIITLSLLSYGIGSITLQRFKLVSRSVVAFISLGVFFDIIATVLMISGSQNSNFTLHGIVGFSALTVMFVDAVYVWRVILKYGRDHKANKNLLLYSKYAYGWWVVAYFTGSLLVIWG